MAITVANVVDKTLNTPNGPTYFKAYRSPKATGKIPAFIFITGLGESGTGVLSSSNPDLLYSQGPLSFIKGGWAPENFMIFAFQTPYKWGPTWKQPSGFMRAAVSEVVGGNWEVDVNKVYLTGLSYGAAHIENYMQFEPDATYKPIAAAIPMSISSYGQGGAYPNDFLTGNDSRFAKIPMWGFCGTSDDHFGAMNRFFTVLLAGAKYPEKFTTYAGGHGGWSTYYDPKYTDAGHNIYDWALGFSSNAAVQPPPVVTDPVPVTPTNPKLVSITLTFDDKSTKVLPIS